MDYRNSKEGKGIYSDRKVRTCVKMEKGEFCRESVFRGSRTEILTIVMAGDFNARVGQNGSELVGRQGCLPNLRLSKDH